MLPLRSAINLIKDINADKITITNTRKDDNHIYFTTSNKCEIKVFNDCGVFDYIDHVKHGANVIYCGQLYPDIRKFHPTEDQLKNIWKWQEAL